jgi:ion channel POLLUX/CASTOR
VRLSRGDIRASARWRLDRVVSRGTPAIVGALVVLVVSLSLVDAALRQLVAKEDLDDSIWRAFSRLVDVGSLQEDQTWAERLVSIGFVLVGIVCVALVIALVMSALQNSIDRVRNAATPLRHPPDLVVLGWSEQIFTLLREFAVAHRGRSAAVLSDRPRAWMDDQIAKECRDVLGRLAIACRSADRTDPRDLELVKMAGVARVVIFGEPGDRDDAEVVKSIFSTVIASPEQSHQRIIAEVCGAAVAPSLADVFGPRVMALNSNRILAFVLAQSVRERGMGQLIDQLTSYRGGEFYEHAVPSQLAGKMFGEVVWQLENVAPVGFVRGGTVMVLPPMSAALEDRDTLIVVDRQMQELRVAPTTTPIPRVAEFDEPEESQWSVQHIGIVGWNDIVARAVEHLRGFLADGSEITVIVDRSCMSAHEIASLKISTADRVLWTDATPDLIATVREELDDTFDAVALVPYRDQLTPSQADATTLLALAAVRSTVTGDQTRIVSELRQSKSAALTTLVQPDDLLLSDSVTASLIAQIADRPWLDGVLSDLLDYHGAALFIHPTEDRLDGMSCESVTFLEVRRAVMRRGELAIGVRVGSEIVLNPPAREPILRASVTGVIVVGAGVAWTPAALDRGWRI